MKHPRRFLALPLLLFGLLLTGCAEKTLLPGADLTVTKVEPYTLGATVTAGATATGSASIEYTVCQVTLRSENGVPARLVSYSFTYETRSGEALPALSMKNIPFDLYLEPKITSGEGGGTAAGVDTQIEFSPYTYQVYDLYTLTSSDIAPIRATITMVITDVNGNTILRTAHCLLAKPTTS